MNKICRAYAKNKIQLLDFFYLNCIWSGSPSATGQLYSDCGSGHQTITLTSIL